MARDFSNRYVSIEAPAMKPDVSKLMRMNLPKRDELSFFTVLALPKAEQEQQECVTTDVERSFYLQELDWLAEVAIPIHPKRTEARITTKQFDLEKANSRMHQMLSSHWLVAKREIRADDLQWSLGASSYLILIDRVRRWTLRTLRCCCNVSQILNHFLGILSFARTGFSASNGQGSSSFVCISSIDLRAENRLIFSIL